MQFWFYVAVLANMKLKCMQRALCLLRLSQIFMHISDMSQITYCSIANCLDPYTNENRRLYKSTSEYVAVCYATPYAILEKLIK